LSLIQKTKGSGRGDEGKAGATTQAAGNKAGEIEGERTGLWCGFVSISDKYLDKVMGIFIF
jgi:hypothetical protein